MPEKTSELRHRILIREVGEATWTEKFVVAEESPPGDLPTKGFPFRQMQAWVGGLYEAMPLGRGLVALCDEEGRLKQKKPNGVFYVRGEPLEIVGTIVIARVRGPDYVGLEEGDDELLREIELT